MKEWPNGVVCLLAANQKITGDKTLENPNLDAFRIRTGWTDVQPLLTDLNWSYIDSVIADAAAKGIRVTIGVSAGLTSPKKLYDTALKYTLDPDDVVSEKNGADMPLPWRKDFQDPWFKFIDAIGARYDGNKNVAAIFIGGFMQIMEDQLVRTTAGTTRLEAQAKADGFASLAAAYQSAAKAIIARYAQAFPTTALLLTSANPFPGSKDDDAIIDWGIATYPKHFGWSTSYLHATLPPHPLPTLPPFPFPRGDQLIYSTLDHERFYKPTPPNPWPADPQPLDDALGNAVTGRKIYVEVYKVDVDNPVNAPVLKARRLQLKANLAK